MVMAREAVSFVRAARKISDFAPVRPRRSSFGMPYYQRIGAMELFELLADSRGEIFDRFRRHNGERIFVENGDLILRCEARDGFASFGFEPAGAGDETRE